MYFDPAAHDEERSPRFELEPDAADIVIVSRVLMLAFGHRVPESPHGDVQ